MKRDAFRQGFRGYGLAIGAWATAFAIRFLLADWFPPGFPFLTFFPAVVIVAYLAGMRPALLTAVLSGLAAWWFWIGTAGFDLSVVTGVALAFYVAVVAVDIFFIAGMEAATRKLALEVDRNAALARSRDLLLREVQHRVSNNIQVVSALLRVRASSTSDPGARKALNEASSRTAMIARIQLSLSDADGRATPFETLAAPIAEDALAAAGRPDVTIEILPSPIALNAEEATPVILTMLECVNNALEHGLAQRPGRITISCRDEEGERRLEVRDDGAGLAASFELSTTKSVGLRIISALAKQLGGAFSIENGRPGVMTRLSYDAPPIPGLGLEPTQHIQRF